MGHARHWSLGGKLALVGLPFLLLALVSIALTLWVSWQLDGGAAAVNEAGRMRMQAYRMSLSVGTGERFALPEKAAEFERSLELLRHGDLERPLFVPWDDVVRARFAVVETDWNAFRRQWTMAQPDRNRIEQRRHRVRCRHRPAGCRHRAQHGGAGRRCSTCSRWR